MIGAVDRFAAATLRAAERRTRRSILGAIKSWRRRARAAAERKLVTEFHKRYCQGFTAPAGIIKEAQAFLAKNFEGYPDLRWHELYWQMTGILDAAFIPNDIFYLIVEPILNDMGHALVLADKNLMYDLPVAAYLPEPVLHIVDGDVYLPGFVRILEDRLPSILGNGDEEFVIKPSILHGGGQNLKVLDGASASNFLMQILRDPGARLEANWIVQRRLEQCRETATFNPSSVNTMRVLTLRQLGEIIHLSTVLRIGRKGARADNYDGGGIACGLEEGFLKGRGLDNELHFYDRHPDHGTTFTGEVPEWNETISLCKKMHESLPWFDLISWDIAIDAHHKPRILEFNVANQGIVLHQMSNGPLFGFQGSPGLITVLARLKTASGRRGKAAKGRR